jgi:hypothetical protein
MRRAQRTVKRFGAGVVRVTKKIALMGAALTGAAVAGFAVMIRKTLKAQDLVGKMSDRLGIATNSLVAFQMAGRRGGVALETMNKSLGFMQKTIAEANLAVPLQTAARAFKDLGLSSKRLEQAGPAQAFKDIVDALDTLESSALRVRVAREIFGRAGIDILSITGGSANLRELEKLVRKTGQALDRWEIRKIEEFNDLMGDLADRGKGLFNIITAVGIPLLTGLANSFADVTDSSTDLRVSVRKTMETIVVGVGHVIDQARLLKVAWAEAAKTVMKNFQRTLIPLMTVPGIRGIAGEFAAGFQQAIDDIDDSINEGLNAILRGSAADKLRTAFNDILDAAEARAKRFKSNVGKPLLDVANSIAKVARSPVVALRTAAALGLRPIAPGGMRPATAGPAAVGATVQQRQLSALEQLVMLMRMFVTAPGMAP